MVTPVEKRSSNKFYDFNNDKGHSTDECMQLKKQIKELVRAGKLSHLIKEIKQGRDQPKVGKKEVPAKDKSMAIYMIQPWHRMTRQKVTQSFERVSEITFPSLTTSSGTEGPLVIEAEIGGHMIHRMYVDGGSSTEVLYEHCFNRLRPEIKNQMVPATTSLTGFSGETIWPLGQLRLLVTIGDAVHSTKAWMNFMIVRSLSPYNGIIGRPEIREIQAVPSTAHKMLKFPVNEGIVTTQKRGQAPERAKAIQTEVQKLVEAGIMREVYYHEWLSNPVMVKKHDGSWRMSVDFTNLNKACPQDCYPLPEIDWKVESLYGYPFKCFLDAYKGYHQIQMAESDEEKTAFHTSHGVYCYTKMPFGLKNAGTTYQRLMDKAFDNQVGRNIEVYVDDLLLRGTQKQKCEEISMKRSVHGSGASLILTSPEETKFTYALRFQFTASNNEAEYEALIAGLWIAAQMGVRNVYVLVEILKEKSIQEGEVVTVVDEEGPTWMTPIIEYLKDETLPDDRKEASKLRIKARQYELLEGVLYRRPTVRGSQSNTIGILLANHASGREIVSDKGKQFSDNPFKDWCGKLNITQRFASVKHPQSNELVERANRSLGDGIKARLAVIPAEIGMPTYHTTTVDAVHNDEELRLNLDLLEKRREYAAIHEAKAKSQITKYYNARVRGVTFRPGDFVYRSNDASYAVVGGKLGPK
ncbi:reverse transcriptase domain-containing protein [Tanacetum coccineum]